MANFLSYGSDCLCIHEPEIAEHNDRELRQEANTIGCSSSALVESGMFNPNLPTIRIHRNWIEAFEAYQKFTNLVTKKQFSAIHDNIMSAEPVEVLEVKFKDLTSQLTCDKVWSFVMDSMLPPIHYLEKTRMRVTTMDTAMDTINIVERRIK